MIILNHVSSIIVLFLFWLKKEGLIYLKNHYVIFIIIIVDTSIYNYENLFEYRNTFFRVNFHRIFTNRWRNW